MRKNFILIALAVLPLAAPALRAGTITYTAFITCGSCVTVSLSWAAEPSPGISYVEIDDNFGDYLFGLNTAFTPETTGTILPNPQTISNLPSYIIDLIETGQAGLGADEALGSVSLSNVIVGSQSPSFANLVLEDSGHQVVDEVVFTASEVVPEPAVWTMTGLGLGLIFLWGRLRQRKLRTENAATTLG